jgi:NAD(P)H-flavin reductase
MKLRIKKHEEPHDDYHVFECAYDRKMFWTPGVHGVFSIPDREIEGTDTRYFSIASIHDENKIQFATRIPEDCSHFKKNLAQLKEGDEIEMEGPYGEFNFQDGQTPVIMVVGGVGITPVRALFKELEKGNERIVKLIYSTRGKHLFKEELCAIADANDKITIDFVGGREELVAKLEEYADEMKNDAYYFISGPPGMVRAVANILEDRFIFEGRMIVESFTGYE